MARGLSLSLPLSALAASVALAGCGAGSGTATERTRSPTVAGTGTGTGVSRSARAPSGRRPPGAQSLTSEEMREYDANEGRCHDDGGSIRDAGTMAAYCSFPARANDFHLIETSHEKEPAGEEE